jgi:TRAP-type uncharacterized transport system fused permease subunit
MNTEQKTEPGISEGLTRYRYLPNCFKVLFLALTIIGITLFCLYLLGISVFGYKLNSVQYYYIIFAIFGFLAFISVPARKKDRQRVPWYDYIIAIIIISFLIFWAINWEQILLQGWIPPRTTRDLAMAIIFGLFALEGGRRIGGIPFFILCSFALVYPLFANHMPGVFFGRHFGFEVIFGEAVFGVN